MSWRHNVITSDCYTTVTCKLSLRRRYSVIAYFQFGSSLVNTRDTRPDQSTTMHTIITLTSQWPRWRLKSPTSRLFTERFIRTQIKENIKAPGHWPLCGEFTRTGEFPAQRARNAENVSIWWRHHDIDVYTAKTGVIWMLMWLSTEETMLSFWWNFHLGLHWELPFWQFSVQSVMKIVSKWRHFHFSDGQ